MAIDPEPSGESSTATMEMKSTMRTFPPPLFSRISIPQQYKWVNFLFLPGCESAEIPPSFKANPNSRVVTVVDETTGVEKKRYVNKDRWKGYGPVTAMYSDSGVSLAHNLDEYISGVEAAQVPTEPTDVVAQMRNSINSNIQKALGKVRGGS